MKRVPGLRRHDCLAYTILTLRKWVRSATGRIGQAIRSRKHQDATIYAGTYLKLIQDLGTDLYRLEMAALLRALRKALHGQGLEWKCLHGISYWSSNACPRDYRHEGGFPYAGVQLTHCCAQALRASFNMATAEFNLNSTPTSVRKFYDRINFVTIGVSIMEESSA